MKIGLMNNPSKSIYDEIISFGKAGYDFVDLTLEGPDRFKIDVDKVLAILEQYGLFAVGHTDPCLPYAYPVKAVREAGLRELERCARFFHTLGAKIMNVHPCYACPPGKKRDLVEFNAAALKPIVEMAASYGLSVVFENYKAPFDRVATYDILLKEVPGLQVHLDFGHANLGQDNHEVFCRRLKQNIRHVHFSDNRSNDDHHMPLGVGNIDWPNAVTALKTIGYNDTITLEVFCGDAAVRFKYLEISRKLVRDLWRA